MLEQISPNEQKLRALLQYAPVGLVEIDDNGNVLNINIKAEELLSPLSAPSISEGSNLFRILDLIDPGIVTTIKSYKGGMGVISQNIFSFDMVVDGKCLRKYHNIVVNKQIDATIMVSFDDFTERLEREMAMRQAEIDRAVEQGKFEIASGVLHDIGNAVVGFGAYLTRIKRSLDQNNLENLQNLVNFFSAQQSAFASAIGENKAAAIVEILNGINKIQRDNYAEITKSITEQLNIITHIQEILNIQRQYVTGKETQERKQVNLRSIVNDCLAMLFASLDKRGILVSLNITAESPLIKGDRTKLMQVILNILKNSVEAIDITQQEKNILVNLHSSSKSIILEIIDTGAGFNNVVAEKLFERNFTTKSTGSGIGLHNCKAIIESHSGTIKLTSGGPGKGATTVIEFNVGQYNK